MEPNMEPNMESNIEPNAESNCVFISFGGGNDNYRKRVKQLCKKAKTLNFFNKTIAYSDQDLIEDRDFWSQHHKFFTNPDNTGFGFGFGLWKPHIILKTLKELNDGDFLVYADVGCDINPNGLDRLKQYQEMLKTNDYGLLTFQLKEQFKEISYTKRVLFDFMGCAEDDKKTAQMSTTVLIMKKTPHIMEHMNAILNIGSSHNYGLINQYVLPIEHPDYIDHMHDQSIHSLLVKHILRDKSKTAKPLVIPDEINFEPNWESDGMNYPLWARRHRDPM